ncbi:PIN domain-containing protein [Thermococcus sp.]|uniref:type II toxin-antitoxin system VapC family toxin n=1 Tax=Thermococcus sp. TaxID=35749 RepID=UPI0025E521AF|nr:PIN domain-containing protein [Thermococcus sp.]
MIYVDANIIYNALVETELTDYALKALKFEGKVTSWTAINEVVYTLFRKMAEKEGFRTIYSIKEMPRDLRKGLLDKAYLTVERFLLEKGITSIPEPHNEYVAHQISVEYGLLPADAMILATALSHGIDKIATLDRDFKAAKGIITLLPKEYWGV